ncbi:MAG TPA: DNA-3-methyladenine glycosylase [Pirellulaceae bacterium]|jgi:DNA-3-methyladenine glycosylase|nr:DNA-3-methyladenine glycosylase [Pirellulaceae bacterium]
MAGRTKRSDPPESRRPGFGATLAPSFFDRRPDLVAPQLLGAILFRRVAEETLAARIVETEAYLGPEDPASHAYRGPNNKNAAMFGPPGRAYVYPIHAKWCLNTVTEREGSGTGVLLRAAEPLQGDAFFAARSPGLSRFDWLRGPARLCRAMAIDRTFNHMPFDDSGSLWIAAPEDAMQEGDQIAVSPRVGVTKASERPLRFFLRGSRFVSSLRRWHAEPLALLEPYWRG